MSELRSISYICYNSATLTNLHNSTLHLHNKLYMEEEDMKNESIFFEMTLSQTE